MKHTVFMVHTVAHMYYTVITEVQVVFFIFITKNDHIPASSCSFYKATTIKHIVEFILMK